MEKNNLSLADEVAQVFLAFVRFTEESNHDYKVEHEQGWQKFTTPLNIAALFVGFSFIFLGHYILPNWVSTNPTLIIFVWVYIVIGLLIVLLDVLVNHQSMKGFLQDAPLDFLKALPEAGKKEIQFLESLNNYSIEALMYARSRYEKAVEDQGSIVGVFVGALAKVGIIPAVVALALAAYKIYQGGDQAAIILMFVFPVLGIYFVCFKVLSASVRFKRCYFLLDFHLEQMRQVNSTES